MVTRVYPSCGMGCASLASMVGMGCSSVLGCSNMLTALEASLRSLPRSHPLCTNVSWPLRTSLTVACRSTSGVDERTHSCTDPAPTVVTSWTRGAERYETAVPSLFCCQFQLHWDALPHRPPVPVLPT